MQYPWAVPGAQVICVKSTPWYGPPIARTQPMPQFMQQYTIRAVATINRGRTPALKLVGIRGRFATREFRPLETLTDETVVEEKEPV